MPIFAFIWLVLRPVSKLESVVGWWDMLNIAILIAYPTIGKVLPLPELFKDAQLAWFAGIPALLLLIAGIKLQFKLSKLEQTKPKTAIDVTFRTQVGREIVLTVHNNGDIPAIFSANMTCAIIPGERQLTKILQLMNASMIWESSGTDTETIDADHSMNLKVCYVEGRDTDGAIIYSMNFYKRELSKPEVIPCAEYVKGNPSAPKVQIDITFRANLPMEGKSEWKYEIAYALPSSLLHIKSR